MVQIHTDNHIFIIEFVILMTPTLYYISSYPCSKTSHMFSGRKEMNVIVRHDFKRLYYQHTRSLNTMKLSNISFLWNVKQQHIESMRPVLKLWYETNNK